MVRRIIPLLCIFLCLASCGISKTTSRFANGERGVSSYFPKKAALQLCEMDPSLKLEMADTLTTLLADAGIVVVNPDDPAALVVVCGATPLDAARKDLRDNLRIDVIFIGMFEQRRVEPMLLTRFELRLMDYQSGKLIWAANVKTDHIAAVANARTIAVRVAGMAVESFKKDVSDKSGQAKK